MPVAAAVVGAVVAAHSAKSAASAQTKATDQAVAEQQRQFNLTRQDQAPYLQAGYGALNALQNPATSFQASPDYAFRQSQGLQGINNSFAARGGALSGNALRALTQFNSNLASGEFNNWWNRQAGLAGVGQNTANTLGVLGANTASNVGNALVAGGNARASGIVGQGNALYGLTGDLATLNALGQFNPYGLGGARTPSSQRGPWEYPF